MKKLKYLAGIAATFIAISCGDEFLDTKNLYEKLDVDYYSTPQEIAEALTGTYACVPIDDGWNDPILLSELMSDNCFGGGGPDDVNGFFATDRFTSGRENVYNDLWETTYMGIFRANMILKRFNQAQYSNEAEKNQAHGEAYFLRAYFYFRLAQFFGTVPLIIDPAPVNIPKASPEELYGQIASDLKTAIELMPATRFQDISLDRLGHANKWVAEGFMARVFLFYTGYYEKSELPLAGGGSVTKAEVLSLLENCITGSGHGLISDFRNLWPYSFTSETYPTKYPYAINNNLNWIGEEGNNIETVFAIKYSTYGLWGNPNRLSYCNQMVLYMSLRYQYQYPWGYGWGAGPVNPQLWESFEPGDLRQQGSILNLIDTIADEGAVNHEFIWGSQQQQQETGYWQKKYMSIVRKVGNDFKGIYFLLYGGEDNYQLWNMQDEVLLRFADVLLMAAELGSTNAQQYMDQIRTRAGLGSVAPTPENIKNERKHELAFEGLRYFDLLRWHDVEAATAVITNIPIKSSGVDGLYTAKYRPETKGLLAIPEAQVRLSNGVLKQNPGWETFVPNE